MDTKGQIRLGTRIREIRELRGLTQKELANAMGLDDNTIISKLESGDRRIKGEEIPKLYKALGCSVSELFGEEELPVITENEVIHRAKVLPNDNVRAEFDRIYKRLGRLAKNLMKLESLLGVVYQVLPGYPYFPAVSSQSEVDDHAKLLAIQVRSYFKIGEDPIHNLGNVLEENSVIWARWSLPDGFSGLCVPYEDRPCILLDSGEVKYRQKFSFAHELCHALLDMKSGAILSRKDQPENGKGKYWLIEHRADLFAGKFLMPLDSAMDFSRQYNFDLRNPSPEDIMNLAHYFAISGEAVLLTLVHYVLISWHRRDDLKSRLRKLDDHAAPEPLPINSWSDQVATEIESIPRLVRLSFKAFFDRKINEGALSEMNMVPRTDLTGYLKFYKNHFAPKA